MKKITFILVAVIVTGLFSFTGCKQKDTTPPKIFLSAVEPDSTILNAMYNIPTATADDNFDGTALTSDISIVHNILMLDEDPTTHNGHTKQISEHINDYVVTYKVTDNAGLETSRQLHVVVYNEFIKFAAYYQAKREGDEFVATNYDYNDGNTAYLASDKKTNWRFSFPKLSDISGLKIYGDVHLSNDSFPSITIPKQEKSRLEFNTITQVNDTFLYVVMGNAIPSGFTDTVNFNIVINYNLNKYIKTDLTHAQYNSGQDTTYGHYWKPFSSTYTDVVTETYRKM